MQEADPGAAVQVDLAEHVVVVRNEADRAKLGSAIVGASYGMKGVAAA